MNDLHQLLADRLASERVDLAALSTGAVQRGRRIRRVRRATAGLVAATVVAGVGVGVAALAGGRSPATPQYAAGGSSLGPILQTGQRLHLAPHVTGRVYATAAAPRQVRLLSPAPASSTPGAGSLVIVLQGRPAAVKVYAATRLGDLHATYPDTAIAMPQTRPAAQVPVEEKAAGWTCQWFGRDDKGACTGPGGRLAAVNWYPASQHAAWLDPSKADVVAGVHTYVSPVHGDVFVTVAPATGTTQADIDALASGLAWK